MGTWGLLVNSTSTTLGTGRAPCSPSPAWALKPTTTVPPKFSPALRRLASALPLCPSPWYQAHIGGHRVPPTLPLGPGDKQPLLGVLRESLWLKQHLLLLHPLPSHLCQALLHYPPPHGALGAHRTAGLLDKGPPEHLPSCPRESREVWGGAASGRYLGLAKGNDRGEALLPLPPLTCSPSYFPLKSVVL